MPLHREYSSHIVKPVVDRYYTQRRQASWSPRLWRLMRLDGRLPNSFGRFRDGNLKTQSSFRWPMWKMLRVPMGTLPQSLKPTSLKNLRI